MVAERDRVYKQNFRGLAIQTAVLRPFAKIEVHAWEEFPKANLCGSCAAAHALLLRFRCGILEGVWGATCGIGGDQPRVAGEITVELPGVVDLRNKEGIRQGRLDAEAKHETVRPALQGCLKDLEGDAVPVVIPLTDGDVGLAMPVSEIAPDAVFVDGVKVRGNQMCEGPNLDGIATYPYGSPFKLRTIRTRRPAEF